jgi:TonB family protein
MPSDPNALMLLAARVNGLSGADMKPWHLKASYQTFDADGKPKDQGTFEEWWAGPEKYKISYSSAGFNQVQYRNGKDTWMTGDVKWPPVSEMGVQHYLLRPLPAEDFVERKDIYANDAKIGGVKLKCFRFMSPLDTKAPRIPSVFPVFCFGDNLPAVRVEAEDRELFAEFNNVVRFDGHYISKQIRVENGEAKKPSLNIDVMEVEALAGVPDGDFVAPSSATHAPSEENSNGVVHLSPLVMAGYKIGGSDVRYPLIARQQRVQGIVILLARITKTGDIAKLEAVSGPSLLRDAAVAAVKTWKYKPYLLNGQPVEVETQVSVVFTLGG